jgi:hypothetical protein
MIRSVLAFIANHPVAIALVAAVAAVVIVALNPGDVWAWIIGITGAAWLGLAVTQQRRQR